MAPNSELKRATDRVARFEGQLTERLDEDGQTILAKLIEPAEAFDSTGAENIIELNGLKSELRICTQKEESGQ